MNNILVSGGAGFIGSNFIEFYLENNKQDKIINLDLLNYAGSLENTASFSDNENYTFIKGDICDEVLVKQILKDYNINIIVNFAAQSHVDNSIKNPYVFVQTNINGTFNLLHNAYSFWFESPFKIKKDYKKHLFYHISTDEVFGTLGESGYFSENSPYAPNSPYSASKASSDMLVRAYHHTYGLKAVISNCSNNYGEKQHDEKLIPTIIRKALKGENIPIYGDGKNVRDWLYVKDHCKAIFEILKYGLSENFGFDTFNIGTNEEYKNIDLALKICEILDDIKAKEKSYKEQITFVQDRFGHDKRYAIDASKIKRILNFKPSKSFDENLLHTVKYYIQRCEAV